MAVHDDIRNREVPGELLAAFVAIRDGERQAVKSRSAREVLGSSVIRVFARDTKSALLEQLLRVNMDMLPLVTSEAAYRGWFIMELDALARVIKRCNPDRPQIYPGYKWGHAAKVLALYCRDIVLRTRYFTEKDVNRLLPWLYVPIDRMVINKLRVCGVKLPFRQIKDIDTANKFFDTQELLGTAARQVGIARIHFDDVWMDR